MLRLLIALDFSECSRVALRSALAIAQHVPNAEIVLLSVLEALRDEAAQSDKALGDAELAVGQLHEMFEAELRDHHGGKLRNNTRVHYTTARGTPADEIVAQALAHRVDAIIMGSHGRTGLNRLLAGSVAERVVRTAPCSVLTVKPKKTS
jgi:universal stress protein A